MANSLSFGIKPLAVDQIKSQLIDVRRAETFAEANDMIAGARYADPSDVPGWFGTLDPELPVVVYCFHGLDIGRSTALSLRARGLNAQFMESG